MQPIAGALLRMSATALVVTAAQAQAQSPPDDDVFSRGHAFVRYCDLSITNKFGCISYVLGLSHGLGFQEKRVYCLPAGVDTGQLYEVGMAYIRDNPARSHLPPFALMYESWVAAFPCQPWQQ